MTRVIAPPASQVSRGPEATFTFDGVAITGYAGESVAVALMRAGQWHLRDAPMDGCPRGAFCLMGVCQECVVLVDGIKTESCRLDLRDGLSVVSLRRDDDDKAM